MIFDIISLVVLIVLAINGYRKGAINTIFDFTKIILSIILVPRVFPYIEKYLLGYNKIIIYVITFIITIVALSIVVEIVKSIIDIINLGIIDKLVGLFLGILEAYIITYISLIILLFAKDYYNQVNYILSTSRVAYYISLSSKDINSLLPQTIKERLDDFYYKNKKIKLTDDILDSIKKEIENEN